LGFIQGQVALLAFLPQVSRQLKPSLGELRGLLEEVRIVRLMEHGKEANAPRVAAFQARFIDKNRNAPVNVLGQLCVATRAKDRTSTGVRIQQLDVFAREGNVPSFVVDVLHALSKKDEVCFRHLYVLATEY